MAFRTLEKHHVGSTSEFQSRTKTRKMDKIRVFLLDNRGKEGKNTGLQEFAEKWTKAASKLVSS